MLNITFVKMKQIQTEHQQASAQRYLLYSQMLHLHQNPTEMLHKFQKVSVLHTSPKDVCGWSGSTQQPFASIKRDLMLVFKSQITFACMNLQCCSLSTKYCKQRICLKQDQVVLDMFKEWNGP